MILFQKKAWSFDTGPECLMIPEKLRGACKPAWLPQSMIILEKASRRVPRHLSIKSAHGYVSDVSSIVTSESWHNF